jgi:hypothetical protein
VILCLSISLLQCASLIGRHHELPARWHTGFWRKSKGWAKPVSECLGRSDQRGPDSSARACDGCPTDSGTVVACKVNSEIRGWSRVVVACFQRASCCSCSVRDEAILVVSSIVLHIRVAAEKRGNSRQAVLGDDVGTDGMDGGAYCNSGGGKDLLAGCVLGHLLVTIE